MEEKRPTSVILISSSGAATTATTGGVKAIRETMACPSNPITSGVRYLGGERQTSLISPFRTPVEKFVDTRYVLLSLQFPNHVEQ